MLRRAVGAEPAYALGWFNLGVVLAGMGPANCSPPRARSPAPSTLDPDLRDRKREATIDARTYRTGLDVSRPLPPEWSFAESQERAPAKTVGLVAILLAAFTLSRALGSGPGRALAETWLAPLDRATGRFTFLRVLGHPAIAIVGDAAGVPGATRPRSERRHDGGGRRRARAVVLVVAVVMRGAA